MNMSIDYSSYLYFFMAMRTFTLMFPNVLTRHMLLHLHVSPGPSPFPRPSFTFPFSFFFPLFSSGIAPRPPAASSLQQQPQLTPTAASNSIHAQTPQLTAATAFNSCSLQGHRPPSAAAYARSRFWQPQLTPTAASNSIHTQQPRHTAAAVYRSHPLHPQQQFIRCRCSPQQYQHTPTAVYSSSLPSLSSSDRHLTVPSPLPPIHAPRLGMTPSDHHPPPPSCRTPMEAVKHQWDPLQSPSFRPRGDFEHRGGGKI